MEEKNKHLLIEVSGDDLHVELENMSIDDVAAALTAFAVEDDKIAAALLQASSYILRRYNEQREQLKGLSVKG